MGQIWRGRKGGREWWEERRGEKGMKSMDSFVP